MKLTLIRMTQTDFATYGRIETEEHEQLCVTLELPWRGNQRGVSCIPAGTYTAVRYRSPKHGVDVWLLKNVPGRTMIELHIANLPRDLNGCIGVGTAFGAVEGQPGITGSRLAFKRLMKRLENQSQIQLTVVDPVPTAAADALAA